MIWALRLGLEPQGGGGDGGEEEGGGGENLPYV